MGWWVYEMVGVSVGERYLVRSSPLLNCFVFCFAGRQVYDLLKELRVPTPKNVYVSRDG